MVRVVELACLVGCLILVGAEHSEQDTRALQARALEPENLIAKDGYPIVTYRAHTADGYILTLHRIPNTGKPVVYLQHGILSSSADWVILGPGKSLAYLLHDAGYDVWLGNSRGSTYSRAHEKFSTNDKEFWDFSWHQIGVHDVPTSIDFILNATGQPDLQYVGHSQGTTAFFVMASSRPEYNAKVRAMYALAPIAFMEHVRSVPIKILSTWTNYLGLMSSMLGVKEFLPNSDWLSTLSSTLCKDSALTQKLCTNTLFLFVGFDSDQLDTARLPLIMQYVPAGASVKQFVHYGQLIKGKAFRHYDFGFVINKRTYGVHPPPEYNLTAITTPVYLHYSDNDLLGTPEGAMELTQKLPRLMQVRRVPHSTFNHMDFLYAKDSLGLLYESVMAGIAANKP